MMCNQKSQCLTDPFRIAIDRIVQRFDVEFDDTVGTVVAFLEDVVDIVVRI